jgi:hypothetical protein
MAELCPWKARIGDENAGHLTVGEPGNGRVAKSSASLRESNPRVGIDDAERE